MFLNLNNKYAWATILTILFHLGSKFVTAKENLSFQLENPLMDSDFKIIGARGSVRRNLEGGKGSKKSKKDSTKDSKKSDFQEVCVATAILFSVDGPTTAITGRSSQNPSCAAEGQKLAAACAQYAASPIAQAPEKEYEEYVDCLETTGLLVDNWYFNRDAPSTFQFVANPSNDGDGSFKGIVSTTDRISKVELEYFNEELKDKPLDSLTNIQFDYFIEKCPEKCDQCVVTPAIPPSTPAVLGQACPAGPSSCLNQIYVNIYTRKLTGSNIFYDCRYDFVLGAHVATGLSSDYIGKWLSVSFNPLVTTGAAGAKFSSSAVTCPPTYAEASAQGFVLSTNNGVKGFAGCGDTYSIKLNIGDTSCNDSGMIAYFDNIKIDFDYEDGSSYHLYNMVA